MDLYLYRYWHRYAADCSGGVRTENDQRHEKVNDIFIQMYDVVTYKFQKVPSALSSSTN